MEQNGGEKQGTADTPATGAPETGGTDADALSNPELFEAYDEAMGELSDADGAASLGGPAA